LDGKTWNGGRTRSERGYFVKREDRIREMRRLGILKALGFRRTFLRDREAAGALRHSSCRRKKIWPSAELLVLED
jgi:hypothetical protein